MTTPNTPQTVLLDLDKVDIPADAREHDPEKLKTLAADIYKQGQLQEIVVAKNGERYEVLAGQGRVLALRTLKKTEVRASVREGLSDFEKARVTFAENEDREDVDPLYQASQIQKMLKAKNCLQKDLAKELELSEALVSAYILIAEIPPQVKAKFNRLNLAQLIQIARLNDAKMQIRLAQKCRENDLSVRQLKALVDHKLSKETVAAATAPPPKDPLAEIWRLALWNPTGSEKPTWGVEYGPQRLPGSPKIFIMAWHLWVSDPGKTPKEFLRKWFLKMAEVIGDTEKEEETTRRAAANWEAKTPEEAEEMLKDNNRARSPKTPVEEAELKALAKHGPGPVYAWVFGAGGYYAKRSKGLSWKDLGLADAKEGYKKVVEMARALEAFDAEKFNQEMLGALGKMLGGK